VPLVELVGEARRRVVGLSARHQLVRNVDAYRLGCLEIDEELYFRLLDREVARFGTLKYFIEVDSRAAGLEIDIVRLLYKCAMVPNRGRGHMSVRRRVTGRGRRAGLPLIVASIAVLPALAGCSSSASTDYAADAYPSQSLANLIKGSLDSPPPARTAAPPAPPSSSTAAAAQLGPAAPSDSATVAAARAPSTPADDSDLAGVYPSVSLIELLSGSTKPATH